MERFKGELSLGHTVLRSMGSGYDTHPVVDINYTSDPRMLIVSPRGDGYLRNAAVPAVRPGEQVLATALVPGMRSHYEGLGLVSPIDHIHEVTPRIENGILYGYPTSDPLATLKGQDVFVRNGKPLSLVSTFTNGLVAENAQRAGLVPIERPDSIITNNKANLRNAAEQYGFAMVEGVVVTEEADVAKAVNKFRNQEYGVWLKLASGSGGDVVTHIHGGTLTEAKVYATIANLKNAVTKGLTEHDYPQEMAAIWPENKFTPDCIPVVIEKDVRNEGELLLNGSTQFITSHDGSSEYIGHSQQLTSEEGEYLGNIPYSPDEEINKLILEEVSKVARYSHDLAFRGIQGVDWFLVRNGNEIKVLINEWNARPTANTPPVIIAQKLGADHWVNTNITTDDIRTYEDYRRTIGDGLLEGTTESGLVVVQSSRTLVTQNGTIPSGDSKVLIVGSAPDHCDTIVQTLQNRGVKIAA